MSGSPVAQSPTVVELRRYRLVSGRRDELIELFEREFLESQEAVGMSVIGHFCDAEEPDHFVWLRGFTDMTSRAEALGAFYGGPVWREHGPAANATMIDSDDVLLLRPARADLALARPSGGHPPAADAGNALLAWTAPLRTAVDPAALDALTREVVAAGMSLVAVLETEPAPNTFRALPVREGEGRLLVWLTRAPGPQASQAARAAIPDALARCLREPPAVATLIPAGRSLLR